MGLKKGEVVCNIVETEITESFLGVIQKHSDKKATFLKCSLLVAYSVYVVWLKLKSKERRYLTDREHNLLGYLPVESGEMTIERGQAGLGKDVSQYGFTSLEVVLLETVISQTFSSRSLKK